MTPDDLGEYQLQIEGLASNWLRPDTERIRRLGCSRSAKDFNDPIWRTIVLYPLEVAVLDSRLLQRLRFIKQLGVADLVFPGATQTRFNHSIGTVQAVERLVASINDNQPQTISDQERRLLRLTALCHDVGHGVMSHVSDNAMKLIERCEDLRLEFQRRQVLEVQPSLSEIAAYFIVGSPAFQEFLSAAVVATNEHVLPDEATRLMQRAIVGLPISNQLPQLHELISGPFDGDKLDYMTRDAFMAGVPVVTDIPRLALKVRSVRLAAADLPVKIAKTVQKGEPFYTLIGIAHSGGRTLDELMLGRILLFDKIYRHHKVRAVEAMVALILTQLARVASCHPAVLPLLLTDEQLLDLSVEDAEGLAGRALSAEESIQIGDAIDFAKAIKLRELLVRAYAFSLRMPLDPYQTDEAQRGAILDLMRTVDLTDERGDLIDGIAAEVSRMLGLVDPPLAERYAKQELRAWIWLDPPESSQHVNVFSRAYLMTGQGKLIRFRDDYSESKSWTDAYLQARDVGYVFGPRDLAPYVFLASEKVARERFGLRTPSSMLDYAKQSRVTVDELRTSLAGRGYYSESPPDLRPLPQRLNMADVPIILAATADRLSGYMGPSTDSSATFIEEGRIEGWVRQFEDNDLVDAALLVVQAIRIIGRNEVVASVRAFVTNHPEFRGASMSPIGSPKDSSYVTTYFAQDVALGLGLTSEPIERGLRADHPLVFVDDFIGSGGQAIDILEAWLGEERTADLGEEREALLAELADRLRERKVAFVYAAGLSAGAERLQTRAQALGLDCQVYVHVMDDDLPRVSDLPYADAGQKARFTKACEEIGEKVLTSSDVRHPEMIPERRLGYGNHGLLLTFPYNTPTQTMTCLWSGGHVDNFVWLPLLPRRQKE